MLAVEIRGGDIEATPHIKYLAFYIDHILNWKKQVKLITMKFSGPLGILNYSKNLFQFGTLKTLCTRIIEPISDIAAQCRGVVGKLKLTDCKHYKIEHL